MGARVLVVVAVLVAGAPAHAQRREGKRSTSVLEVVLPVSVMFGEIAVTARTYRVSLSEDGFAFADPRTMVLMATVPVEERATEEWVEQPRIELSRSGDRIEITMRVGDRIYRAAGIAGASESPQPSPVVLAGKTERAVKGGGSEQRTAAQLVARATKRYMSGIKHCADKAHRGRWGTDDIRFIKCVCPIVLRWKMPALEAPLLMHWPLAKGRHGFSFHVTRAGKVTSCRVWAGPKPPPGDPKKTDSSEEGSDAAAAPPETEPAEPAAPVAPEPAEPAAPEAAP